MTAGWSEAQEVAAATYLQEQTAIASFELCRTFVRGMVRAAGLVGDCTCTEGQR